MNRKNSGKSNSKVSPHPNDPILWNKVDPDGYAGGLVRAGYEGDAGYDLCASRTVTVPASGMAQIPTNVAVALPVGKWAMVIGRSSTFFKRQLLIQNAVIDNGWRGELWSVARNMSDRPVIIRRGERVSQLVLFPLITPEAREVKELPISDRGIQGFGSTGVTEEETNAAD